MTLQCNMEYVLGVEVSVWGCVVLSTQSRDLFWVLSTAQLHSLSLAKIEWFQ